MLIQGEQFYLFWHAYYNDARIVCDHEDANASIEDSLDFKGGVDPSIEEVRQGASELDLTPVVSMEEEDVQVDVVIFTKWGGFIRDSTTMKREFPHERDPRLGGRGPRPL
ncbi:MAG: hypothetical protein APR56_00755 [Methanosaeta sp. SDB]|nr:MAG: hypothetical protein APR56_00755 [Methanosaeta sp. SDB]